MAEEAKDKAIEKASMTDEEYEEMMKATRGGRSCPGCSDD